VVSLECASKEMSLAFLEYGKVLEPAKYWLSYKNTGKNFSWTKHSSLLCHSISYNGKTFVTLAPGANIMEVFSFVTDNMHKKLECFFQDGLECASKEISLPFLEYGKVLESAKYWLS
jgi:hypothetical protein